MSATLSIDPPATRTPSRPRALIIGAGPGGLASALMLAHGGFDVRVVERLPSVGGRCSTFEQDGFRFDVGPTFFLYPQVLERIFRRVGRDLRDEVEMTRLDPQYRLIFGSGGRLDCTANVERMEAEIARLCPQDAGHLRRFLDENRNKLDRFRPVLESAFLGWRDLLSWELLKLLPILRPWRSLDSELGRHFNDDRVRLAFAFQSKYLGMSPFQCPSLFSILSFLEYEHGVWHPTGGCGSVSEKMADVAEEMGVTFSLGEEVTEILFEGKRAIGVRTDHGEYGCDALVINADFSRAMTRLIPDRLRRRWTDRKIAKKKFSCSTFMMYLGLDGLYDHLNHHTIYMAEDYPANLKAIATEHRLTDDPSLYVQNASVTDETLAPPGMSTLYVLAPVTHQHPNVNWAVEGDRFREVVLRQLEDKLGCSDIHRRVRFERVITPANWESDFEIYRGATFNLAHNLGQMLHLRPRNRFEDLESVYLVGGGTHPGSGLPVIYESARITSRLMLRDFELNADWIEESESLARQPEPHILS